MITQRLRQDASFMRVLTRAGGWKNAFLIDEVETQRMSATLLEAADRIEALERELKSREGKPMTERDKHIEMAQETVAPAEDAFQKWAGTDSPVIEPDEINDFDFSGDGPFVVRAFHGTTHEFTEFNASVGGTKEGQFGAVNYFTSSESDATENYTGDGPDLTNRIEQQTERLSNEIQNVIDDEGVDEAKSRYGEQYYNEDTMEFARNIARVKLHGGNERTLEVFIRTEKPFIVGSEDSPWVDFIDQEAMEEAALDTVADNNGVTVAEVQENIDDYEDELSDARYEWQDENNELMKAITTVAERYDLDAGSLFESVMDVASEGANQSSLEELLRSSEALSYAEDPEDGSLVGYHALGEIIQELGFDSIILKNAGDRFSDMNIEYGTAHIHVFDSNNTNIKSVDNNGAFDPSNPSILKQSEDYRGEHMGCIRSAYKQALPQVPEGMAIVPVERITTVARDVDYSPHTNRHTPFLRINFSYDDYDSRDAIYTMLAAAKCELEEANHQGKVGDQILRRPSPMSDKAREQHDKFYQECGLHANIIINAGITQREVELLLAAQSAASWQAAHEMYSPSSENVHICTTCSAGVVGMVVNGNLEPYEYDDTTQLGG